MTSDGATLGEGAERSRIKVVIGDIAVSRMATLVAVAAATVGVIYGYDTSNIAGALLFLKDDLRLTDTGEQLIVTAVVVGEIVGAILGGPLANRFGRRRAMIGVAVTFALFSALSGLAPTLTMLVGVRFLLGMTIGVSLVAVPVFIAESSPSRVRGAMLVLYQVACVTGIILGYLIAWALAPLASWRWMLALAAIPATLVVVILRRLPDTARWHMMNGRRDEAREILRQLDPHTDVEAELDDIADAVRGERSDGGIRDMVRRPFARATVFVVGLGFFVQITGINAIVYYSPRIFEAMGQTGNFGRLGLPAIVQVAGLLAVVVSLFTVDRLGRRPILLTGIGIMIAANALLVAVFATGGEGFGGVRTVLGMLGLVLFTIGFTYGFGALVWVYAGESFPARLRSLGAGVMLTSDLVANAIISMFFLTVLHTLGGAGTFVAFGLIAVAAFGFVYLLAPETKGRDLEEIRHFWENGGRWEPARTSVRQP